MQLLEALGQLYTSTVGQSLEALKKFNCETPAVLHHRMYVTYMMYKNGQKDGLE